MSTSFDNREKAFENKFKNDEELKFKVNSRAVHLLGLWTAAKMGLSGKASEEYAQELVDADFEEAGSQDVYRKVIKDLAAKTITVTEKDVEKEFQSCLAKAKQQLMS
jgi:hypothetical protein